jgi:hypothetical protein
VSEGSTISVSIQAVDVAGDRLGISVRNLPPNAYHDRNRSVIVFSPDYEQSGQYLVLVDVSDGRYSVTAYFAFDVLETNRSPLLRDIGERYVTEGKIISFEINASDADKDPITFSFTGLPGVATLVNNLFTFDTQLLPSDLQADAVLFVFGASDGQGGSDTQSNNIAIIRKRNISLGGTLLAADVGPGDSLNVPVGDGIGMGITITSTTGGTAGTSGSIDVSEISGPLTAEIVHGMEAEGSTSLLAAGKFRDPELGTTQTVRLAGGGTAAFTSIRRGWGADLSNFTPSWPLIPDGLDSAGLDSLMASDSIKINFVVTYLDSDLVITLADTLVKDQAIIDSLFRTGLVPAAWDSVLGQFVLLEGVVDTLSNQFYFTIPFTREDTTAGDSTGGLSLLAQVEAVPPSSRYTLFTVGSVLDFVAPEVKSLSGSFNSSSPGPITIKATALDQATGIRYVRLFYTVNGVCDSTAMMLVDGNYECSIPVQEFGSMVEYYIHACDNQNNISTCPASGTYILSISEQDPSDLDANGTTNIFDLLDLLRKLKAKEDADVNLDGKTDIFDLLTLLKFIKGSRGTLLAGAGDENSPFSQLLSFSEQAQEHSYQNSFSVGIEGSGEVVAAQLVFKLGEGLEIGNLAFEVDDPLLQFFVSQDKDLLTVMVYHVNGEALPVGEKLLSISYRTADGRPLDERMISLESSVFGDIEGAPVQAKLTLSGVSSLPRAFALAQNYPNPFNPSTTINYDIPDGPAVQVALRIYNVRGQLLRVLVDEAKDAGSYSVQWDGTDGHGRRLASGVYFYRLVAGKFIKTRKMVILK